MNKSVVSSEESGGKRFRRERDWSKEEVENEGVGHNRVERGVENRSLRLVLVTRVE